jgi:integrase/recombinase XerD
MLSFLTRTGICLQYQSLCNMQWRGLKALERSIAMKTSPNLAGLLEAFFVDRLMRQRQASRHTVASYRDTFCLLLRFAQDHLKKAPSTLTLDHLNAPFIGAFLDHIEKDRGNNARSRNARLAAIHSFFHYASLHAPEHSALIQRVLSIPSKRYDRAEIEFLDSHEIKALLAAPDVSTRTGRRDRTLLLVAVQTGLRVSELVALRCEDVMLGNGAHVRCMGKGRKERCTPLRKDAVIALRRWLHEIDCRPSDPLFPSTRGGPLGVDGVAHLLSKHLAVARKRCVSLEKKRVSPHVLRHSAAMELLKAGVDQTVIALWLGHERLETTQMYLHASLELKEQALAKTTPSDVPPGRFKPDDNLLAFLKTL